MWILHCNVLVLDCILSKYKLLHCLVMLVALKCSDLRLITLQWILRSYITQLHWIQQIVINYIHHTIAVVHWRNCTFWWAQNSRTALQIKNKMKQKNKWHNIVWEAWAKIQVSIKCMSGKYVTSRQVRWCFTLFGEVKHFTNWIFCVRLCFWFVKADIMMCNVQYDVKKTVFA